MNISIRFAGERDVPTLRFLIEASVLGCRVETTLRAQLERALKTFHRRDAESTEKPEPGGLGETLLQ
jgi:hypothetical protein